MNNLSEPAVRAMWHILHRMHHVVVDGVPCAARFFRPDEVRLFDYDTHRCFRRMSCEEFITAANVTDVVPEWLMKQEGHNVPSCPTSAAPSTPSSATGLSDHPAQNLLPAQVLELLRERRSPADSW